jgi:hypothetical protein
VGKDGADVADGKEHRKHALWLGLLLVPIVAVAVVVLYPTVGRHLTLIVDELVTVPVPTPPVNRVAYDGDFRIGDLALTSGTLNNDPFALKLCTTRSNMVVLKTSGHSFILGPRTNPVDKSGRPDVDLVPERGDTVTLTARRSLVGWPTPFDYTIMVSSPSWRRYVYYRLVWKKRSGAQLEMTWRYEQDYFRGRGWIQPTMMWDFRTGLLQVAVRP